MYRYGIVQKSGECQIFISDLSHEKFMEYLNSAEWVCLKFCVPSKWENLNIKDIYFNNALVSIKNIESIVFVESEDMDE